MGIIDKPGANTDARFRSLLQKAVRRGNLELVYTTSALLGSLGPGEKNWYRSRCAVITFEECWPLGGHLRFNRRFHSKVHALVRVARSTKAKDAYGLGCLGYALHEGDQSVLGGDASDRHLKIIANAIRRPDDFWDWIEARTAATQGNDIADKALQFRNAGLPRDRAVIQAAAYLAVSDEIPPIDELRHFDLSFPYWVALDLHTRQGKRVLGDISRDLQIPLQQLEWCMAYHEGTATNATLPSKWWQRYCQRQFKRVGLPADESHLIWDPVRTHVIDALSHDSRQLHGDIYRWKMDNMDRVEALKKQVEMYDEYGESEQSGLF